MNLLFAINGGYIPTFLNCMRSVLLHGGASHYEVFILHSDLTDGDEADIRAALPDVGLHFVFVDPAMFDGFPESKRYPRQIYYRIAAPLLLPDTLERILYLDADTIIINPLTTLYETPFGDAYFMACTHTHRLLEKLNAARLGMDCVHHAMKPAPFSVWVALARMGVPAEQAVLVGDQVFTDLAAGNLAGVRTILVRPLSRSDMWYTHLFRVGERLVLHEDPFRPKD